MAYDTRAPALLAEWLQRTGTSQSALARRLEIGQSSVSYWITARTRPETHLRTAIERITGISRDSWLTTSERALLERIPAPAA